MTRKWLITLLLYLPLSAYAVFDINVEHSGSSTSQNIKGAIDDTLFYSIGGGTVLSQPPTRFNMERIGIGVGWKSDLMCGNFDVKTSVKNQLNGVTKGFKNLMGDIVTGATGAVASLPAMIIQRANPGLYELITNGVLQSNLAFDKAQFNCQNMSQKLADLTLSNKWTQAAAAEEYKSIVSNTKDGIAADHKLQQTSGREGVSWVGGQRRGGAGQPAIKPTYDITTAGFNILNKQPVTSNNQVTGNSCTGSVCQRFKSADEAAAEVVKVLGDRSIRTCKEGNDCRSGGVENEPGSSVAGTGFYLILDKTAQSNYETLVKLVNGDLMANETNLSQLKTGDLVVSKSVIQSLQDDPDNFSLTQRLASELAMADTVSTALTMRRMLIAGLGEPNVAEQAAAVEEADRRLEFLDKEILALRNEMELRKAISNNSLLVALTRQQQRQETHRLKQEEIDTDHGAALAETKQD